MFLQEIAKKLGLSERGHSHWNEGQQQEQYIRSARRVVGKVEVNVCRPLLWATYCIVGEWLILTTWHERILVKVCKVENKKAPFRYTAWSPQCPSSNPGGRGVLRCSIPQSNFFMRSYNSRAGWRGVLKYKVKIPHQWTLFLLPLSLG